MEEEERGHQILQLANYWLKVGPEKKVILLYKYYKDSKNSKPITNGTQTYKREKKKQKMSHTNCSKSLIFCPKNSKHPKKIDLLSTDQGGLNFTDIKSSKFCQNLFFAQKLDF